MLQAPLRKLSVSLLLAALLLSSAGSSTFAQTTNWVSGTTVKDITGNATLHSGDPLVAGHTYNMTIDITVPFNATSQFQLTLNAFMNRSGSQFWYVLTPNYKGYNASSFTGGTQVVMFKQVAGTLVVATLFTVPQDFTISKFQSLTLHNLQQNVAVVFAQVIGGSSVGGVMMNISDQVIQKYLADYQQKSTLVSSGMIDSAYSNAVNAELAQAYGLYGQGLAEQADALLLTIVPSNFPAPPNGSYVNYLLIGVVIAAVLAVAFLVFLLRSRGRSGFYDSIASEVQKELAALEVTAAQYDKALADRLKRLRERLGERL